MLVQTQPVGHDSPVVVTSLLTLFQPQLIANELFITFLHEFFSYIAKCAMSLIFGMMIASFVTIYIESP
jgi:hypothetical protein